MGAFRLFASPECRCPGAPSWPAADGSLRAWQALWFAGGGRRRERCASRAAQACGKAAGREAAPGCGSPGVSALGCRLLPPPPGRGADVRAPGAPAQGQAAAAPSAQPGLPERGRCRPTARRVEPRAQAAGAGSLAAGCRRVQRTGSAARPLPHRAGHPARPA